MRGSSEPQEGGPPSPAVAGLVAVDPAGRIIAISGPARRTVAMLNVGWDRGGYVGLRDKDLDRSLKTAIRRVSTERPPTPRAIRIDGEDGMPPILLVVDALEEEGSPRQPIIVLCQVAERGPDPEELLVRRYHLSRAEAGVAILVARGVRPRDVAARRGVSVATVRTQLKAVFHKLECRSQSALARRVRALLGETE